jgi:hypothetical protein
VNVPAPVGVPEIVITLDAHEALTHAGKPLAPLIPALLIPVAPVVAMVIGVRAVFVQSVGLDDGALAVLSGFTVMLPVALRLPHPPVKGIL